MTFTIADTTPRSQYTAAGGQTVFTVPFEYRAKADVKVLVDGTLKTLDTDYTMTDPEVSGGGSITFTLAPGVNKIITIYRDMAIARTSDQYTTGGQLPAVVIEASFDDVTMKMQQLERDLGFSSRVGLDEILTPSDMLWPTKSARLGKFARWNSGTGKLEPADISATFTVLTQSIIGGIYRPQTPAEAAALITPTNYYYEPGDVRRYGAVGDGVTDDSGAFQKAFNLPHPVLTQPGTTYYIVTGLTWDKDYAVWYANRCILTTDQDIILMTVGPTGVNSSNNMRDGQIIGFPELVSTHAAATKSGWLFRQCLHCDFEISANHFYKNVEITTTAGGYAYNVMKFGYLRTPRFVNLHLNPTSTGWVNENTFAYGRWSQSTDVGVYAHIWAAGSGSFPQPNNNLFLHNSLEGNGTGSIDWAIVDEGFQNQYIQPRLEITVSNTAPAINAGGTKPSIYVTANAEGCVIDSPYYPGGIHNLGLHTTIRGPFYHRMAQRGGSVAFYSGPALELNRGYAGIAESAGGHPLISANDIYDGAGTSQTFRSVVSRASIAGSYHLKCCTFGQSVSNVGRHFECLVSHTSDAVSEPGVGADWRLWWGLKDTSAGTAPAWVTATPYTGRVVTAMIDGIGAITGRHLDPVSADRGDTAQTLVVGTDSPIQRWATALTANRIVTLSVGGVKNGDKFRVVRTGLGAFTLDVGGLKTIPAGTAAFVDVHHDGTAWRLTGYGTL